MINVIKPRNDEQFRDLCASLGRTGGVMSRVTNSEDASSEDGEGKEPVQGVVAQRLFLPAGDEFIVSGNLRETQNTFVQVQSEDA